MIEEFCSSENQSRQQNQNIKREEDVDGDISSTSQNQHARFIQDKIQKENKHQKARCNPASFT